MGASTATAAPATVPSPEVGLVTTQTEAGLQTQLQKSQPVIATYQGKEINLAEGWQGAQACTETPGGKVYCYASAQEADRALPTIDPAAAAETAKAAARVKSLGIAGPMASGDCSAPYVCLWENSNYTGRRLQWSASGTKQLSDWDFRDTASSGCVNRVTGGATVYDDRSLLPDPYMALGNLGCYDFTTVGYPTGGSWNDKADYIEL